MVGAVDHDRVVGDTELLELGEQVAELGVHGGHPVLVGGPLAAEDGIVGEIGGKLDLGGIGGRRCRTSQRELVGRGGAEQGDERPAVGCSGPPVAGPVVEPVVVEIGVVVEVAGGRGPVAGVSEPRREAHRDVGPAPAGPHVLAGTETGLVHAGRPAELGGSAHRRGGHEPTEQHALGGQPVDGGRSGVRIAVGTDEVGPVVLAAEPDDVGSFGSRCPGVGDPGTGAHGGGRDADRGDGGHDEGHADAVVVSSSTVFFARRRSAARWGSGRCRRCGDRGVAEPVVARGPRGAGGRGSRSGVGVPASWPPDVPLGRHDRGRYLRRCAGALRLRAVRSGPIRRKSRIGGACLAVGPAGTSDPTGRVSGARGASQGDLPERSRRPLCCCSPRCGHQHRIG